MNLWRACRKIGRPMALAGALFGGCATAVQEDTVGGPSTRASGGFSASSNASGDASSLPDGTSSAQGGYAGVSTGTGDSPEDAGTAGGAGDLAAGGSPAGGASSGAGGGVVSGGSGGEPADGGGGTAPTGGSGGTVDTSNVIQNPGFESALASWSSNGDTSLTNTAHGGAMAASIGPATSNLTQVLPKLSLDRCYTLSFYDMRTGSGTEWSGFGIAFYDGSVKVAEPTGGFSGALTFGRSEIVFRTPLVYATATLWFHKVSGSSTITIDDVTLVQNHCN